MSIIAYNESLWIIIDTRATLLAGRMKFDIRNISGSLRFESDEGQVGLRDKGVVEM